MMQALNRFHSGSPFLALRALVMEEERMQSQSSTKIMNDYEKSRRMRVQENKTKLQALGVKHLANSLTSLVESDTTKRREKKTIATVEKNVEHMHCSDFDADLNYEEPATTTISKNEKHPKYIAPMLMNRYANIAKQMKSRE